MNLRSIMASSANENQNGCGGVQSRRRPTNNQLLYKAHFHWKFYSPHHSLDVDGLELSLQHKLPTATQECASVTTAFLQVLKVLYEAELVRGTPRNCLEYLASNTRRTKVLHNGSAAHRNGDEMRKNVIQDKEGNEFTTNLDRNRYGSDNNYLSTVIRYDLEYLGLNRALIEVEIIDAKSGKSTDMNQPLNFTKGSERTADTEEATAKLESKQGNGIATLAEAVANKVGGGNNGSATEKGDLARSIKGRQAPKTGVIPNEPPGTSRGMSMLLSAVGEECRNAEELENRKRATSTLPEVSKGEHGGKRAKVAVNGTRNAEPKQEVGCETPKFELSGVCDKLKMECAKIEKEKMDLEHVVQEQSRNLIEASKRESILTQRAENAERLLSILGVEMEAMRIVCLMTMNNMNGVNTQQASTRGESLRASTNTTHQQAVSVNAQDRRNTNSPSGNPDFNQAAYSLRGGAPSYIETMNAALRSSVIQPQISALMNMMAQNGGNPAMAGMIPMVQAIGNHENLLAGSAARAQLFASAQGEHNQSVLQPTPTHAVGPLQMEGITDNGSVRP